MSNPTTVNRDLKRTLDIAVSLPVVVFIIPPLTLLVWLGQRLQAPGPLLFVRPRGGKLRSEFGMLKFRSMYTGTFDVAEQASVADDRIYPLGRFLRKTSLDELLLQLDEGLKSAQHSKAIDNRQTNQNCISLL